MRSTSNSYSDKHYLNTLSGLEFDGVDDYVQAINPLVNIGNSISISIFFKPALNNIRTLIGSLSNVAGTKGIEVSVFDSTNIQVILADNSGTANTLLFPYIELGLWQHLVLTIDIASSTAIAYINAVKVHEETGLLISGIATNDGTNDIAWEIGSASLKSGTVNNFNGVVAHNTVFNKILKQAQIEHINRYVGVIPESAMESCVFNLPLQYNDFLNDSVFNTAEVATQTAVNQTGHGFSQYNAIYNDGSIWQLADSSAEATYSDPPTIVTSVTDANNFSYAQAGDILLTAHGLGNAGDILYVSNDGTGTLTTEKSGNPIAIVLDADNIRIASEIAIWTEGAVKQYNFKKTIPLEVENYGEVFGKSVEEILTGTTGTNEITAQKDFYTENSIIHPYGRVYDTDSYDQVVETDMPVSFASNYSIYLNCKIDEDLEEGVVLWYGNSNSNGSDGEGLAAGAFYRNGKTMVIFLSNSDSGSVKRFYQQYYYSNKKEKEINLCFVKGSNTDSSAIKIFNETGALSVVSGSGIFTYNLPLENKTAISPNIVSIGRRPSGVLITKFNGIVSKLQWVSRPFTDGEATRVCREKTTDFVEPNDSMYAYELNFKNTKEGEPLKTTPRSLKQHTFTRFGTVQNALTREKQSLYPPIIQGTRLQNINAGGSTNQWVEMNASSLPTALDDFTIHKSFDPIEFKTTAGTSEVFKTLLLLGDTFTGATRKAIAFTYRRKEAGVNTNKYQVLLLHPNGDIIFNIETEDNGISSLTLNRINGELSLYFNGVLIGTATDVGFDISAISNPFFTIGANPAFTNSVNDSFLTNHKSISTGIWSGKSIGSDGAIHLHGNGKPNNPWDYLPLNNRRMKDDLILWHQFQGSVNPASSVANGSFSLVDENSQIKVKNWADDTGVTDAEYVDFNFILGIPAENAGVWSTTTQATGVKTYDITLTDITGGGSELIASATGLSVGTDLTIASNWLNFSSAIAGITATDIASNIVAGSNIPANGTALFSFDFQNFVVNNLPANYQLVDNIQLDITVHRDTNNLSDSVQFDETADNFSTQWTTATASEQITLPFDQANEIQVDWGDGNVERVTTSNPIHIYATAGTYTVRVNGYVESIDSQFSPDKAKLVAVTEWGDLDSISYDQMFIDCTNLTSVPATPMTGVQNINGLSRSFRNCPITSVPSDMLANFVSLTQGTAFQETFAYTNFDIPTGFFDYDWAETVTGSSGMSSTFRGSATTVIPAGLLDRFINTTYFFLMFGQCPNITTIPSGLFANCTSAINLGTIFTQCSSLTTIPVDIFGTGLPNVTSLKEAFLGCSSLTSIPDNILDGFTSLTNTVRMFQSCSSATFNMPANFFTDCSNLTICEGMFAFCTSITGAMATGFTSGLTSLTDASTMFRGCTGITGISTDFLADSTDIDTIFATFLDCTGITSDAPSLWLESHYTGGAVIDYNLTSPDYDDLTATSSPPVPDGERCFDNCPSINNLASIPTYWK